jgi:hypothetical protein
MGWSDSYLGGPAFEAFLDEERTRVARVVSRLRAPAAGLAGTMSEWAFPLLVLLSAPVIAGMLFFRRSSAAPHHDTASDRVNGVTQPSSEPLTTRPPHNPLLPLALGLLAFVALLELAGFVVAGTALFACAASAFGSRRRLRDALVGFALCAAVYALFVHGLGVMLPAGLAASWL